MSVRTRALTDVDRRQREQGFPYALARKIQMRLSHGGFDDVW